MNSVVMTLGQITSPQPISAAPAETVKVPSIDWVALLPVIVLALGALLLITLSSLIRRRPPKGVFALYTVVVAIASFVTAIPLWARVQGWSRLGWIDLHPDKTGPFSTVGEAVGIDGFSLFITTLICFAVIVTVLFASDFLDREGMDGPEPYVLLLLSATGGIIMAMANDLVVLFLGLETLSLALYVMAAMNLRRSQSQEGAIKYFLLGSLSAAFFLYGVAMIYGATGSTNLLEIKDFMAGTVPITNGLLMLGIALMLVGLAFKAAVVPFHSWSPDTYEGTPTPFVAFMASGVKAAAFAGLVRVFVLTFSNYAADWQPIVYTLALLSLIVGAVLAIVQRNVKRMFAYSSIAHVGFILMALEAASEKGVQAILFYLFAYTFMVAGSFGVITLVGRKGDARHDIGDYRGLTRKNPALALTFSVLLLAQAGVPFTSGFFAKFYAVAAAVDAHSYWLAIVALVSAVASAFLYLRLVIVMNMSADEHGTESDEVMAEPRIRVPFSAGLGLALCLIVTLGVGILPATVFNQARDGQPSLVREISDSEAPPVVLEP